MRSSVSPGRRSRTRLARWSILLGVVLLALAPSAVAATWTAVPSPNLTQFDNVLWGVDARSSTSAWAVGRADTGTLPIRRPVIERWNGTSWSISPSPLPPGAASSATWTPPRRAAPGRSGSPAPATATSP